MKSKGYYWELDSSTIVVVPDPDNVEVETIEVETPEVEIELVDDLPLPILTPPPSPVDSSCGME